VNVGPTGVRLKQATVAALLMLLVAPVASWGEPDGPKLAFVGKRPIEAQLKAAGADFGVTVRNDSDYDGPLGVRLVLDAGADVRVDPSGVDVKVGDEQLKLTLTATPSAFAVRPRDAARIVLHLQSTPVPKQSLTGTFVISARARAKVTPLTARITIAPPATTSRFDKAKAQPATVTLIVKRWWPSFVHRTDVDAALISDRAPVDVKAIASATTTTKKETRVAHVASDTGGRGTVTVTIPAIAPTSTATTLSVDPSVLPRRGTYDTVIPLDDAAEKSPTLTVKVIVGDHWMWPLFALIAGALLAYFIVSLSQMTRPRWVLQLALTRAQARALANVKAIDDRKLTKPYTLDKLFPTANWDCASTEPPEALRLYCAIAKAQSQEDLDGLATQVADLAARVDAWPSVCAKAHALHKAASELAEDPEAATIKAASLELLTRTDDPDQEIPTSEAAAKAYMQSLDDQVKAVREWLNADVLLEEGLRLYGRVPDPPREHDPARWRPDLRATKSLADLERCGVVAGLCRDVHVLRGLALIHDHDLRHRMLTRSKTAEEAEAAQAAEAADEPGLAFITVAPTPPALPGPQLTTYLVAAIRTTDWTVFWVTTAITALAYLVGVYSNTYGSVIDYLTAFAAGAGATFVANWKLLPWYSSSKPPKGAKQAAAGG
jgi:hypothetical protein